MNFLKRKLQRLRNSCNLKKSKWFKNDPEKQTSFQERWNDLLKSDSEQLIPPSNAYVLMNLLEAVVKDSEGTARRAQALNRPIGGKTGTTDGYYDTWFVGASPFISTGVWMGFDSEKTLGKGETGSRAALPAWMDYMKQSHEHFPPGDFPVPNHVVFANISMPIRELWPLQTVKMLFIRPLLKGASLNP